MTKEYVEIGIHLHDHCGFWNRERQSETYHGHYMHNDRKARSQILAEMAEDGWRIVNIVPGLRASMAEHWQPEVITFERDKPEPRPAALSEYDLTG
jgi:hypothetical protein